MVDDGAVKVQKLLEKLPSETSSKDSYKKLKAVVDQLVILQEKHQAFKDEYATEMLELAKKRMINAGPKHAKLKTVPWSTGAEKTAAELAVKQKKKKVKV